jgi:hypothetical protein
MQRFARGGSVLNLGLGTETGEDVIREKTAALLGDRGLRRKMSEAGANLVEPGGAANVADVIDRAKGRGPANGGRRE